MDEATSLIEQITTLLMGLGGGLVVIAFIVVGFMFLLAARGDGEGVRKRFGSFFIVAVGAGIIGCASFLGGMFLGIGDYLGQ